MTRRGDDSRSGVEVAAAAVIMSRCGAAEGCSDAASAIASLLDRWKNFGNTSCRFSAVSTFATSTALGDAQPPVAQGAFTPRRW